MRRLFLTLALGLACTSPASAATWAESLFSGITHDFGTVARGPTVAHTFRITNTTGHPVHIAGIRVSCGCTSAAAQSTDLAPGQGTDIVAQMDTRRFVGFKNVTIYVQFDRPQWDEVRLTVTANARDDMALVPEMLAFGSNASRSATVTFLGSHTHLISVQAESNYLQLEAKNVRHSAAELAYEITATLRPDTPAGKWFTDIWLNTNNPSEPRIRLPVAVDVAPALQFSAPVLAFGAIKPGEKTEKRIILRGPQPFRITSITGTDESVTATAEDAAKPVHIIVVGVKPASPGDFARTLKIATDLSADAAAELPVTASVAMPHVE